MSELNIELLKKVRDKIAATPEAYDQSHWGRREGDAPCGTAACIAGWTCAMSSKVSVEALAKARTGRIGGVGWVSEIAASELGLTPEDECVLFNPRPDEDSEYDEYIAWPEPFASQWAAAGEDHMAQAAVAVAYLDHIIATGSLE